MTGSCSTCSPLPGPATPCSCPSHVPPCTWLSPHLVPDLSMGFCLRSKTQTWILTPTTPGGVAGVEVCIWPVAEGRRQLGHDIPASTRCNPGVRRCSAPATRQPPRAMSQRGWGTGQSCHPLGLRSWVSSQPFQERPGPAQPAPSPLHEALTLQMFRDSAYSRNSQRARNSGWRAAASCGICQHRRKVSGGRCSPFNLLYRLPPAATSPRGLPQPLCPSQPGRASAATTLLGCRYPPASPCKTAAPGRGSTHRSPACSGKAGPISKQSAGNQFTASSPRNSPASRITGMREA